MNETIDLARLWNVFKHSFIVMILLGSLGMFIAYFGAKTFIAHKYSAYTDLLVNRKTEQQLNMQSNETQADITIINTYKDNFTRPVILREVADDHSSHRRVQVKKATKAVVGTRYNAESGVRERYVVKEETPDK